MYMNLMETLNFLRKKIAWKTPLNLLMVKSLSLVCKNLIETLNLSRNELSLKIKINVFSIVIRE